MPVFVTLDDYQAEAMRQAIYESMPDGTVSGRIPPLASVWASAPTLAECRAELQEVLEGWIRQRLASDLNLPDLNGLTPIISTALCPWQS